MSKNRNKINIQPSADPAKEMTEVRRLLDSAKHKLALERAKALHKQLDSPATGALLEDAYAARVIGLRETGLLREAAALIEVAALRFPSLRDRLSEERLILDVRSGSMDEMIRRLGQNPGPSERAEIERVIANELTDLRLIINADGLAMDHPLRVDIPPVDFLVAGALRPGFGHGDRGGCSAVVHGTPGRSRALAHSD